jgi:hypothetical protein
LSQTDRTIPTALLSACTAVGVYVVAVSATVLAVPLSWLFGVMPWAKNPVQLLLGPVRQLSLSRLAQTWLNRNGLAPVTAGRSGRLVDELLDRLPRRVPDAPQQEAFELEASTTGGSPAMCGAHVFSEASCKHG